MAERNLSSSNRKYIDYAESNQHFLNLISNTKKESHYIDSAQLKKKISLTAAQLKSLSISEVTQWQQIHMLKLRQLASFFKQSSQSGFFKESKVTEYGASLREQLHLIVEICRLMKLEYNSEEVAHVIQQFYFREYKDDILSTMEEAGYNTNSYRVLYYEQSSFFSFFCCWETNAK